MHADQLLNDCINDHKICAVLARVPKELFWRSAIYALVYGVLL